MSRSLIKNTLLRRHFQTILKIYVKIERHAIKERGSGRKKTFPYKSTHNVTALFQAKATRAEVRVVRPRQVRRRF